MPTIKRNFIDALAILILATSAIFAYLKISDNQIRDRDANKQIIENQHKIIEGQLDTVENYTLLTERQLIILDRLIKIEKAVGLQPDPVPFLDHNGPTTRQKRSEHE